MRVRSISLAALLGLLSVLALAALPAGATDRVSDCTAQSPRHTAVAERGGVPLPQLTALALEKLADRHLVELAVFGMLIQPSIQMLF